LVGVKKCFTLNETAEWVGSTFHEWAVAGASLVGRVRVLFASPGPAVAQSPTLAERTATPEAVTTLFLRSVRAIRWSAATQFISAETLARFREVVTLMADADTTG
jgi:hypothetical protein